MKQTLIEFFSQNYSTALAMLALTYFGVVTAVAADLVTGLRKARRSGLPVHSTGLKRSCRKMADYILPMIALSAVDLIVFPLLHIPLLTMLYGAFCILCETVSIFETSDRKKQLHTLIDSASKSTGDVKSLLIQLLSQIEQSESNKETE